MSFIIRLLLDIHISYFNNHRGNKMTNLDYKNAITHRARIKQIGENVSDSLYKQLDELRNEYFTLSKEITNSPYSCSVEQFKALSELGQIAIAIKALQQAREEFGKAW